MRAPGAFNAAGLVIRVLRTRAGSAEPTPPRNAPAYWEYARSLWSTGAAVHAAMMPPRSASRGLPSASAETATRKPSASNVSSAQAARTTLSGVSPIPIPSRRNAHAAAAAREPHCRISRSSFTRPWANSAINSGKAVSWTSRTIRASAPARSTSPSRARASTLSRAPASISAASRSSITEKCGATPDSRGKRRSRDWQNAWMVWMPSPPGVSSTSANSRRARAIVGPSALRPEISWIAGNRSLSLAFAHPPRRSAIRVAISAAAALVNVRQRMFCGRVPASSRLSTRSVRTLVFPVPAEAETQIEVAGSAARRWPSSAVALGSAVIRSRPRPRPTIP